MIPNRIVLDTNVCLDLFIFEDPRWAVLNAALRDGRVHAVTRDDCRDEWQIVLTYARFKLAADQQAACLARFDAMITCLPTDTDAATAGPATASLPRCSDGDDQKFLEVARDTGAAMLITKDKALLKLAGRCRRGGLFTILKPEAWVQAWMKCAGAAQPVIAPAEKRPP